MIITTKEKDKINSLYRSEIQDLHKKIYPHIAAGYVELMEKFSTNSTNTKEGRIVLTALSFAMVDSICKMSDHLLGLKKGGFIELLKKTDEFCDPKKR